MRILPTYTVYDILYRTSVTNIDVSTCKNGDQERDQFILQSGCLGYWYFWSLWTSIRASISCRISQTFWNWLKLEEFYGFIEK